MQVDFDSDTRETSLGVSAVVRVTLISGTFTDVCSSTISACLTLIHSRPPDMGMSQAAGTKVKLFRRPRKGQLPMAFERLSNTSVLAVENVL